MAGRPGKLYDLFDFTGRKGAPHFFPGTVRYNSSVRLNRFLQYVNRAIAVLVVLAAIGVWWIAWRPLPQTSGTIAGGVAEKVTVSFDSLGEPHVTAANQDDLLFAQGYLTA